MHRETDGAPGVGDAPRDGLADPPGGVGGELEALAPVELLDGVHQAEVALLDQVQQRQARRLILLRDRHDQTQVRLDEGLLGLLTLHHGSTQLALLRRGEALGRLGHLGLRSPPALDGLGQADLVVLGQQGVLPDVGQVQPDEILVVALDSFLRQDPRRNLPSQYLGRGAWPGIRARMQQPTPVPGVRGLRRQCNGTVKMGVQQGKRRSRQTPVRPAPRGDQPAPLPSAVLRRGHGRPVISATTSRRAPVRTSRTEASLTGDADSRWAPYDRVERRQDQPRPGGDPAGVPRAPPPARRAPPAARPGAAPTRRRPHRHGPGGGRPSGPRARRAVATTAAHQRVPRHRRARPSSAPGAWRPQPGHDEDVPFDPAVGPDQRGELVDAAPARPVPGVTHPPTPRGPRSGSGW